MIMNTQLKTTLRDIGYQLDSGIYPEIKNGGVVVPSESPIPISTLGKEKGYETSKSRRSKTRSRQRATGRQGQTSATTPLILTDIRKKYEAELSAVREAYPNTQVWSQQEALWLITESALLPGLNRMVKFVTAIPFNTEWRVQSWGFWDGQTWIGPRHTNFPNGSVCAFEPADGTWITGNSIVMLLDIYSLWALRHLHLQLFNRWPGRQAVHFAYERILELKGDEYCGCEHSEKLYSECCQQKDLARNRFADAIDFTIRTQGGLRNPPDIILKFLQEQKNPPNIKQLF